MAFGCDKPPTTSDLLGPEKPGVLTGLPTADEVRQLIPGLIDFDWHVRPGERVGRATNLFNSPGVANVKGTPEELEKAYQVIRQLESQNFYRTRPIRWFDDLQKTINGWVSLVSSKN